MFLKVNLIKKSNHPPKQNRIIKTAKHFLMHNPDFAPYQSRFDLITFGPENRWIEGAFFEEDLIPE